MLDSETALEELKCRALGDLLQEGCVAKIADDIYYGGNSLAELLVNWRKVLMALEKCDLRFLPRKLSSAPCPPPSLAGYGHVVTSVPLLVA